MAEAGEWGASSRIRLVRLDVTDEEAIRGAVNLIEEQEGRLDALINLPGWNERLTLGLKSMLPWGLIERAALRLLGVKR